MLWIICTLLWSFSIRQCTCGTISCTKRKISESVNHNISLTWKVIPSAGEKIHEISIYVLPEGDTVYPEKKYNSSISVQVKLPYVYLNFTKLQYASPHTYQLHVGFSRNSTDMKSHLDKSTELSNVLAPCYHELKKDKKVVRKKLKNKIEDLLTPVVFGVISILIVFVLATYLYKVLKNQRLIPSPLQEYSSLTLNSNMQPNTQYAELNPRPLPPLPTPISPYAEATIVDDGWSQYEVSPVDVYGHETRLNHHYTEVNNHLRRLFSNGNEVAI
ncbi:uncharacterized protein LOC130636801 [Hydractinia symbiolongicarpus]|uniref:uncharacterized protein LOC130636801 n=1 Tax=Hydractinia symbiolongicarpus TaxID=13093 RepID=UPI00254CB3B5|nr:uncharacterized protein LOC130636801 [Hydractinia symbiolongicarpus]